MSAGDRAPELPEHFFRHEFGRLVAVLSRRFGLGRLELCEDAAQTALMRALETWSRGEVPRDRGAWLYRVASNHVLDALRRERPSAGVAEDLPDDHEPHPIHLESEVTDD